MWTGVYKKIKRIKVNYILSKIKSEVHFFQKFCYVAHFILKCNPYFTCNEKKKMSLFIIYVLIYSLSSSIPKLH